LYGIALIALLQVTDNVELGLFTLFNNLHNFILALASYIGLQSLLQFSANDKDKSLVNFYSLLNCIIIVSVFTFIIYITQTSLSNLLDEPRIKEIATAIPLLSLLSIPRYFMVYILYRELQIFKLFIINLIYFGTMSGMIFYNVVCDNFLTNMDLIHITYIGSIASVIVGIILTANY
jgi:hypothetical protein